MAALLDLNIDALKYPDMPDAEQPPTSTKSLPDRIKSVFRTDTTHLPKDKDISIPKGFLPTDYKVFLILKDFLQPHSSITANDAVDRLLDAFPDGDMRHIISVCLTLAEQIPYNHPSQAKLARMIWLVGRSEVRIEKLNWRPNTQSGPGIFYQSLHEDIVDGTPWPENGPTQYINYQAFEAHLNDTGVFLASPYRALQAMESAFSDAEDHLKDTPEIRDAWVLGAAQWILWNGQQLFKLVHWREELGTSSSLVERQRDDAGNPVPLEDCWNDWKRGFERVIASGSYGEECAGVCRRVVEIMDTLERGMTF